MPQKSLSPSPRQELLQLEKRIFTENKEAIKEATVVDDRNFKRYNKNYQRAVASYRHLATVDEVMADVEKSRIVLVGDYHTLDQSQRSFVRFLRSYLSTHRDRKITVALEAVQARFQKHLEHYLLGKISSEEFIRKIGFRKHWFFDLWPNYEIIFDFLAYHHIPIQAIDADNRRTFTLVERDEFMAAEIIQLVKKFPEEKIMVLVGDLHLAPEHLPRQIQKLARREKLDVPLVMLYQNSPHIHWQLSEKQHVDQALIVKIAERQYCRMHTPPIIVQQSYLNWLFHEEGAFDWVDAKASFLKLVQQIAGLVALELPPDFEDIEVYTCGDLSFLKSLRRKGIFSRRDFAVIERRVSESKSYFLPQARLVYIANVSTHHAAQEASRYLRYLLVGTGDRRAAKDVFYLKVIEDGVAFFGSKLINPKRKCAREKDYKNEIRFLESSGQARRRHVEHEVAELFVQHARSLRRGDGFHSNKILNMSADVFTLLSRAIGFDFGDQLYFAFMEGRLNKDDLRGLYTSPFDEEGAPAEQYQALARRLRGLKRPMQI